jgi:hypothetical protein
MASILKVDTIQDQSGNNIINENADTITIGASGRHDHYSKWSYINRNRSGSCMAISSNNRFYSS